MPEKDEIGSEDSTLAVFSWRRSCRTTAVTGSVQYDKEAALRANEKSSHAKVG